MFLIRPFYSDMHQQSKQTKKVHGVPRRRQPHRRVTVYAKEDKKVDRWNVECSSKNRIRRGVLSILNSRYRRFIQIRQDETCFHRPLWKIGHSRNDCSDERQTCKGINQLLLTTVLKKCSGLQPMDDGREEPAIKTKEQILLKACMHACMLVLFDVKNIP